MSAPTPAADGSAVPDATGVGMNTGARVTKPPWITVLPGALHVAEKRPPTDDDRPPPSTFSGRKRDPLPDQLSFTDDAP